MNDDYDSTGWLARLVGAHAIATSLVASELDDWELSDLALNRQMAWNETWACFGVFSPLGDDADAGEVVAFMQAMDARLRDLDGPLMKVMSCLPNPVVSIATAAYRCLCCRRHIALVTMFPVNRLSSEDPMPVSLRASQMEARFFASDQFRPVDRKWYPLRPLFDEFDVETLQMWRGED